MEYKKIKKVTPKIVKSKLAKKFIGGSEAVKPTLPNITADDFKPKKPKTYKRYSHFSDVVKKSRLSKNKIFDYNNDIDVNFGTLKIRDKQKFIENQYQNILKYAKGIYGEQFKDSLVFKKSFIELLKENQKTGEAEFNILKDKVKEHWHNIVHIPTITAREFFEHKDSDAYLLNYMKENGIEDLFDGVDDLRNYLTAYFLGNKSKAKMEGIGILSDKQVDELLLDWKSRYILGSHPYGNHKFKIVKVK